MSTSIIQVEGVSVSYDRKRVLVNIFLNIEAGHIYGIVGPNGAGKSTLFKAMLDLVDKNSGEVRFFKGQPIEKVRKRMAYVPQKSDVDWTFPATVFDIVLMGRYPHKKLWQRIDNHDKSMANKALEKVGMQDFKDRQIGELSGGQQQRVFIARALAQDPDIFFLDEPFVGVDIMTEEKIIHILRDLAQKGKTILVIHHDLNTVEQFFDKVILLNGHLVAYGDTDTIFTDENIAKTYSSQATILHKTGGY